MTFNDNFDITDDPLFANLKTKDERKNDEEPQNIRYVLYCPSCGTRWERQRNSKLVKQTREQSRYCTNCGKEDGTLKLSIDAKHGITPEDILPQITTDLDHRSDVRIHLYTDELGYFETVIWEGHHCNHVHYFSLHPRSSEICEQIGGARVEVHISEDDTTSTEGLSCELEREILADDGSYDVRDWEYRKNELLGFNVTR